MSALLLVMAAFLSGLVSFSSPCCLPLLPGYVAYVGGQAGPASPRRTMMAAGLFVVGFGVTFSALGASASWLGRRCWPTGRGIHSGQLIRYNSPSSGMGGMLLAPL